ncbi:MAG: DedA family protein [Candidatus Pacebacteria bacterium]|nr:DedA family protein [Candidatus Paceibacterota bacterium]
MFQTILHFLNPEYIIGLFGVLGVWLAIFMESGILLGIVLPGDSLLFTAGLLASQGLLQIWPLVIGSIAAAIIGDSVGYSIGKKAGKVLFERKETFYFRKEYVDRAHVFFEKYGARAVLLARFVPIVRTLIPPLAGISSMPYKTFIRWNVLGGIIWTAGVSLIGYTLGSTIPGIDHYITPIILVIILVSFIPAIISFYPKKENRR